MKLSAKETSVKGDGFSQSHQVSNELARVGNMVVSIIDHKNSGHIKRPLRRNRFALESLGFFSKKSFNPLVPSQWTPAIAGVSRFAPRHRSTPAIQNTFLQKGLHSQPFFVKYFGSAGVH